MAFMKKVLACFIVVLCFTFYVSPVLGQYGQYGQPSPSLSLVVDKMVGKPNDSISDPVNADYVDNLSPTDPRFRANRSLFFKAKVKNTSNTTLYNVTVTDYLPSYIEPVAGPGTYDGNARTITFSAGDFAPKEEKTYYFKMHVDSVQYLPADKSIFCIVNQVKAYNDKVSDDDTAQFCIEKEVFGVAAVPAAGPEFGLLIPLLSGLGMMVGLRLKRRSG